MLYNRESGRSTPLRAVGDADILVRQCCILLPSTTRNKPGLVALERSIPMSASW